MKRLTLTIHGKTLDDIKVGVLDILRAAETTTEMGMHGDNYSADFILDTPDERVAKLADFVDEFVMEWMI